MEKLWCLIGLHYHVFNDIKKNLRYAISINKERVIYRCPYCNHIIYKEFRK